MENERIAESEASPTPLYLREWRMTRGMKQRQVENLHGWPVGKLSRLEVGKTTREPHLLAALARTYACSVDDLFRLPPEGAELPATGLAAVIEMNQMIVRLQNAFSDLKHLVGPKLDTIESDLAKAGRLADHAAKNAEELAETFARYIATAPKKSPD